MSLPMTYSRRKRVRLQSGKPDIFRDDVFGQKLLTQILQVIIEIDAMLGYDLTITPRLVDYLKKELGSMSLARSHDTKSELYGWFMSELSNGNEATFDLRLDVVELACVYALEHAEDYDMRNIRSFGTRKTGDARKFVEIINARMMEDGFGFQFEGGQLVQVTSKFEHQAVIIPALAILEDKIFEAANVEFRSAFEEFKQRQYDDCIADCGNAFESVLKVIAARQGWANVKQTDPAAKLIEAAYQNGLIPSYMQEQFTGLRLMLQGAPTVRNKEGSHGAGEAVRVVDKHLAAYQLHQTAAAIIFLAECYRARP